LRAVVAGSRLGFGRWIFMRGVGFFTKKKIFRWAKAFSLGGEAWMSNLAATQDLRENYITAGVDVCRERHTEEVFENFTEQPDFVVLDPPRLGAGLPRQRRGLRHWGHRRLFYLSCYPSPARQGFGGF